jgi:hypothetical protein
MKGFLIFDLKLALHFLNKNCISLYKKNIFFITDKIAIFELFKSKNVRVICLDNQISNKKRKEIFLYNYQYIDKKIKNFGRRNYFIFDKIKLNSIHNTNKSEIPRCYVGIKYLFYSLNIVLKKNKINEIVFFKDLNNNFLCKNFYTEALKLFCNKNDIIFNVKEFNYSYKYDLLISFSKKLLKILLRFRDSPFKKLFILLKKNFFNIFSKQNKQERIVSIGPLFDLGHLKNNFFDNKLNILLKFFLKKQKKNGPIIIPEKNFKNLDDLLLYYLQKKDEINNEFYKSLISATHKYLRLKKIQKIYWGISPDPLIRNLIEYLKKKNYTINGLQHGGKYFVNNDDLYHKDSDYLLCNRYHSYGYTKSFNKNKFAKNIKILKTGCLKSFQYETLFKNIKKLNDDTLLYVPISLSTFSIPVIETSPNSRFTLQKKICNKLNEVKSLKKNVKVISQSYYRNIILNYEQLETNPIYLELNKFKSLNVDSSQLLTAYKTLKPKIIIMDSLSTPLYELSSSNSEIIIFLDKYNQPKKDVLSVLKKRFFIAKDTDEMMQFINLILSGKKNKNKNKLFHNKFYKKKNFFI